MPMMLVNGVNLHYEVLGAGSAVALSPGARNSMEQVRPLAEALADRYRVLIWDRRNAGASDVSFVGNASESELAMEDLHALLGQLELAPAVIGGTSFGCGVSLLLAIRHPEDVKALLLWGPGGGSDASTRFIGGLMYGQFIEVAQRGGMEAVAETPFFKERIAANAANRDRLLSTDVSLFMKTMARWMKDNEAGARLFVAPNTTEEQVEAIRAPAIVVPGNDDTHTPEVGARLHAMLPGSKIAHHPAPPAFEAGDRDAMAQHQREFASGLAPVFASYLAELGI